MARARIIHWYFIVKENGKDTIVSYGDSSRYTQEEAFSKMKVRYPNCKIATDQDVNRLA